MSWEEEPGLQFNCYEKKRAWFLCHGCEDTGCSDYKPSDFYLAATESETLHLRISYVTLLQISKLEYVNFII